jgi:hypothetical protein
MFFAVRFLGFGVSAWWREVWGWDRVKNVIKSLPGRLGFGKGNVLNFFRLRLDIDTGEVYDEVLERFLTERERYGLYYVLYTYAQAKEDIGELGELVTPSQICPAIHCPMTKENLEAITKLTQSVFSLNPELLLKATEPFNPQKVDIGDIAVKIYTLPRVPIVLAIWLGEESIPPSISILYDKSITNYLDCESAMIMAGVLIARIIISLAKKVGINIGDVKYSYRYQCPE